MTSNTKALICVTVNKDILRLKNPFVYDVNVSNIYLYLTEDLDVYQEKMTARARVVSPQEKHNRNIKKSNNYITDTNKHTHYNTAVILLFLADLYSFTVACKYKAQYSQENGTFIVVTTTKILWLNYGYYSKTMVRKHF